MREVVIKGGLSREGVGRRKGVDKGENGLVVREGGSSQKGERDKP